MIEDYFDIWKGKGQTQGTGLQPDSSPFKPSKELVGVVGGELNQRYVRMLPSNSILYSRAWPGLGIAEGGRAREHHHSQLCGAACHQHLSWYCCPDCRPPQPLTKERDRWRKKKPTWMLLPHHWTSCIVLTWSKSTPHLHLLASISYQWLLWSGYLLLSDPDPSPSWSSSKPNESGPTSYIPGEFMQSESRQPADVQQDVLKPQRPNRQRWTLFPRPYEKAKSHAAISVFNTCIRRAAL